MLFHILMFFSCPVMILSQSQSCDNGIENVIIPKGASENGIPIKADPNCGDRHSECSYYVSQGECTKNPGWMIVNCPVGCKSCHLRMQQARCTREFLNLTDPPAITAGSLESIFSNILTNANKEYGDVKILSTDPWIITIDNFVKDSEVDALLGSVNTWERSTDIGSFNEFGEQGRLVSNGRTSSNSWCRGPCETHPDVIRLTSRIERATTIPSRNYESLQILRYEVGQYYNTHHDTSSEDWDILSGPRILTMFLYLSDVEEGGHTEFPLLGLSVKPKKGMALLWPGVHNHNTHEIDRRTTHTARPVIKGRKYAANSWIHMNDFVLPNLWGCTGAFD